ncbi:MAG: TIGR04283 family arsenosugar biosynthesis glycosyltransferase [Chitinophagaceae bacterium]
MTISIIIPTYNEKDNIEKLIHYFQPFLDKGLTEIIVSDGGSQDHTLEISARTGVKAVLSPQKGRAGQMNWGASMAQGDILYFVHADCLPPSTFVEDIQEAIWEGFPAGCYRFRFDSKKKILRINEFFTRFNRLFFRGGDQTLFITRTLFELIKGFREEMIIMEDYDLIRRIQEISPFRIIPKNVIVSSRKYDTNSWLRVQLANLTVVLMYQWGCSQQKLTSTYKRLLNYRPFP